MKVNILKNKNSILIILGVVIGFLFLLYGSFGEKKTTPVEQTKTNGYDSAELQTYTTFLEKRLTELISEINGVKNVKILVTIESSNETVYAKEGSNLDYVIIKDTNGNESVIPLKEITANIRGIAIVCDYGNNEVLKVKIIELLASLFNIGSNRISVISSS